MATSVQSIIDKAGLLLQDDGVRWSDSELLGWVNEAQKEIVLLKPDAYSTNEIVPLVQGTKQTIPADGLLLLSVIRNISIDGATPGTPVRIVDRSVLDMTQPLWHIENPSTGARHYVYDSRDPKHFYVHPAQGVEPGSLEIVYSTAPPEVALGDNISLDDIYTSAILNYVLYRAYMKDADFAANIERSGLFYQAFQSSLGIMNKIEERDDPNGQPSHIKKRR